MLPVYRINKKHFYPRPPRGGRHAHVGVCHLISGFLSTPSARRATGPRSPPARCTPISIHALREEGDQIPATAHYAPIHFYPRPPRGGRRGRYQVRQRHFEFLSTPSARRATLISPLSRSFSYRFLSTPSARRATIDSYGLYPCIRISIHALREEGDSQWWQA